MVYVIKKGKKFPFSKGILARSIARTGINIDNVYDIVTDIHRKLVKEKRKTVKSKTIKKYVIECLKERGYENEERYYRISREIAHLRKPLIILIGGTTGVGKSTVSAELAHRLGIERSLSSDAIREIMRYMVPYELMPVLHESSFSAGEHLKNPYVQDNMIYAFTQQVSIVCEGVQSFIDRGIKEGLNTILNGVHLVPGYINISSDDKSVFLFHYILHLKNKKKHVQHFYLRSEGSMRDPERYIDEIKNIRKIQKYIKKMAEKNSIMVVENNDFEKTIKLIMEDVITTLEGRLYNE